MRATSYRQAFRARRFLIAATSVLITCLAILAPPAPVSFDEPSTRLEDVASPAHARYQATAVIGVPPINTGGDATVQFKTIAFYVQSTGVGRAFAARIDYTGSDYEMLSELIEIEADEKSGIMTVLGYGGTARQAADITNAFIDSLRDYLSGLGTQATEQALERAQASVVDLQGRIDELSVRITALRSTFTDPAQAALDPQVAVLQAEHDSLVRSYAAAYQHMTAVSSGGTTVSTAGLAVLQPADASTAEELGPSLLYELWVRIVLGVVVGLLLGAALALLLEHNGRRIFSREVAERAFGAPVLVEVPRRRLTGTSRDVVVVTAPRSRAASAYRMLRVMLCSLTSSAGAGVPVAPRQRALLAAGAPDVRAHAAGQASAESGPRSGSDGSHFPTGSSGVGPSGNGSSGNGSSGNGSSGNGSSAGTVDPAGSSFAGTPDAGGSRGLALVIAGTANERAHPAVVANLAATFAETGRDVTVLRIGTSARRRGSSPASDDEVERGTPTFRDSPVAGVRVVDWGPVYGGTSVPDLVRDLRRDRAVVLVDAGRVATAEFAEVGPLVDGVVAVCQIGRTTIENAERTADLVAWSHARLLGVVLAQVPAHPVERVTWGHRRRSPLTSRRGDPEGDAGAAAEDDLALVSPSQGRER